MIRPHFILYVRDQKASCEFYRAVLAMEPALDVPGMTEFHVGRAVIGLMPEAGIKRLLPALPDPSTGAAPRAELYLVVEDPQAFHARALAHGARELSPLGPRDWGHRAAYSLDLDGHVLAFASEMGVTSEA